MTRLRIVWNVALLILVTLPLVPLQWLARRWNWRIGHAIPRWWCAFLLKRVGVRVIVHGAPMKDRPLLLCSNHVSWLDIPVLGSLTRSSFISKHEVGEWPVVGFFADLARTVYVEREKRAKTAEVTAEIARRLADGDAMILFPEGTTSNGNRILPFRSALIGAARAAIDGGDHARVHLQPVSLAYTRAQGMPIGHMGRDLVAWYGDTELAPHVLEVLRTGAIDVEVTFGRALPFDASTDRKKLTRDLEAVVRRTTALRLRGRPVAALDHSRDPD